MTDRAGRWITEQVGRCARSVNEVAKELGCDWHTVNDAVIAYGEALVDHPGRFGVVEALGLDEAPMVRAGVIGAEPSSPPRSSTWDMGNSSTLSPVARAPNPCPGWPHGARGGVRGCASRPWTSQAPIAGCSR